MTEKAGQEAANGYPGGFWAGQGWSLRQKPSPDNSPMPSPLHCTVIYRRQAWAHLHSQDQNSIYLLSSENTAFPECHTQLSF